MPHFLFVVLLYTLPVVLLTAFLFLFFDISPRYKKENNNIKNSNEDIHELEEKLTQLIKNNQLAEKKDILYEELQNSDTNIISAYLSINKKSLKGFHLFQLIFTLIKNQTQDSKIIKILRHYLPSCSTLHLYALLRSCKEFLKITTNDSYQKTLIKDLNQNKIYKTLIYLQQKINQILNQANKNDPVLQQTFLELAATHSIVFANFSQFYDTLITKKMLKLAQSLSPQMFRLWHTFPHNINRHPKKKRNLSKNSLANSKINE